MVVDLNISSNGGNASAINMFAPRTNKMKGFGNFADSNRMSVQPQGKKTVLKKRTSSKARPLKYKQNLG